MKHSHGLKAGDKVLWRGNGRYLYTIKTVGSSAACLDLSEVDHAFVHDQLLYSISVKDLTPLNTKLALEIYDL